MHDIVRLIDDHDLMDKLADRLIAAARPGQADPATCHALMTELGGRLATHLKEEADFLFDDATGPAPSIFGQELARFEDEFAALAEGWNAYLGRWTPAQIAADRAAFAGETADMLTALKLRIARENQVLYPPAFQRERISFN